MQLHALHPSTKKKTKKRVGRGGKRGTYSGRGLKGQKSRAGRRIRPAVRDMIARIPKLRGFKNKPFRTKPLPIALGRIAAFGEVTVARLKEAGLLPQRYRGKVKILDSKITLASPLTVRGLGVSRAVKMKIEKAGGKIV